MAFVRQPPDQLAVFQGASEAPISDSYGSSEQRGKTANWPSEGLSIPEGWNDGSLARSAWEGRTQGSVPLGYGVSSLPLSNELARALENSQRIRQLPDESHAIYGTGH
jgi:hypothetical protein